MDGREVRGLEIAATHELRRTGNHWLVPSQSHPGSYKVFMEPRQATRCECPDYELRGQPCKHMLAVQFTLRRKYNQGGVEVTEEITVKYTQDWTSYNAAQCEEGERFPVLLAELCSGIPEPTYAGTGRPRVPLSIATFAAVMKVYSGFSSRRFTSDLNRCLSDGLIDQAPHFNTVSRTLANPTLTPVLTDLIALSALPLRAVEENFAVDASGFSTCRFERWYDAKYRNQTPARQWIKAHVMCGVASNIVTAAEVTRGTVHDTTQFKPLVARTAENFTMEQVSADKGYLSRSNVAYVEKFGATPYVPFKINTVPPVTSESAWGRMYHRFALEREQFLANYHRRSNVETVFHMVKSKFGERCLSKSVEGQMNEVLAKLVCHNICVVIAATHELGIDPGFRAGSSLAPELAS